MSVSVNVKIHYDTLWDRVYYGLTLHRKIVIEIYFILFSVQVCASTVFWDLLREKRLINLEVFLPCILNAVQIVFLRATSSTHFLVFPLFDMKNAFFFLFIIKSIARELYWWHGDLLFSQWVRYWLLNSFFLPQVRNSSMVYYSMMNMQIGSHKLLHEIRVQHMLKVMGMSMLDCYSMYFDSMYLFHKWYG